MAGGKETPRQKMIGMMYLVLTALLALNISKEVLNGFVKVENSLRKTQETMSGIAMETFSELEMKYEQNKEKVGPFYNQAKEVKTRAEDLVAYVLQLKARSMSASNGDYAEQEAAGFSKYIAKDAMGRDTTLNLVHIEKKDEYQALTTFLIGSEPQKPKEDEWSAHELRKRLEAYRDYLKAIQFKDSEGNQRILPDHIKAQLDEAFKFPNEIENGVEVTWEAANFYDVPLAAVMPLLTKIALDVQDVQDDITDWLLGGVDAKSYKFTALMPLVVPQSSYILRGDSIRADVLLAAFDRTNPPTIYVDNNRKVTPDDQSKPNTSGLRPLPIGSDKLGKLRLSTSGMALGETAYRGVINFQGPDGSVEPYYFTTPTFTIAEPALVVSPTKMNVFYRGLPNPVEISVPGVPSDKITATVNADHRLEKLPDGSFIVRPGAAATCEITVTATLPDGSKKSMPAKSFRVKRIPDPVPVFAGKTPSDRTIDKATMMGAPGVSARMEGFDFDLQVLVKSFTLVLSREGTMVDKPSNSNALTGEQKTMLERASRGSTIYIDDIVVKMPDGTERLLAPIKLKVS
jgi:gliding motility-associated protein GldM